MTCSGLKTAPFGSEKLSNGGNFIENGSIFVLRAQN
jgi:hypothetical protein